MTSTPSSLRRDRQTKIVATLGPSSSDPQTIRALFDAGADAAVPEVIWQAADELFRAALRLGGTLTGQHGVGVLKRRWLADELGAGGVSGAALLRWYARLLGARLGRDVDLHTVPPITGLLKVGDGASIEPEVDLTGHWIDGRTLHVDSIGVGKRARVGARSSLGPGTVVGDGAEISPGSGVLGTVPPGERWAGAPAGRTGRARPAWGDVRPQDKRRWTVTYALTGTPLPPLAEGDILLHGHTHVPAWTEFGQRNVCLNPGSLSIPKENSPHSYMILENGVFYWKDVETGEIYHTRVL